MALKDTWVDKIDGVDINSADDINQVAHAVIELEEFAEDINPDDIKAEIKSYVDETILGGVW